MDFGALGLVAGDSQDNHGADKNRHENEWNNVSVKLTIQFALLSVELVECSGRNLQRHSSERVSQEEVTML